MWKPTVWPAFSLYGQDQAIPAVMSSLRPDSHFGLCSIASTPYQKPRPMDYFNHEDEDEVLMGPEAFADRFGISRAFVHLVLANGCPHANEGTCRKSFFEWLDENTDYVRCLGGLLPLAPIPEDNATSTRRQKRKRAFLTTLEFTESRACLATTRNAAREVSRELLENW